MGKNDQQRGNFRIYVIKTINMAWARVIDGRPQTTEDSEDMESQTTSQRAES